MAAVFFSASWQWGDFCLPCPDKNSSTSVRREPNIGVRRSRTTMGDRCISMPTMFSVPGGTPVGRGRRGISPAWLSGNSFSTERVPLGVRGAERPRKRGCGGIPPHKSAGGPQARTEEGRPQAAQRYFSEKTTGSHPPARASAKRLEGAGRPRLREGRAQPGHGRGPPDKGRKLKFGKCT